MKTMATITLKYDPHNPFMRSYLNTAVLAGFKIVDGAETFEKKLTPFEKSLEDIKFGRVTRIKNVSNLVEECLV